jgi:hypothetical protein
LDVKNIFEGCILSTAGDALKEVERAESAKPATINNSWASDFLTSKF